MRTPEELLALKSKLDRMETLWLSQHGLSPKHIGSLYVKARRATIRALNQTEVREISHHVLRDTMALIICTDSEFEKLLTEDFKDIVMDHEFPDPEYRDAVGFGLARVKPELQQIIKNMKMSKCCEKEIKESIRYIDKALEFVRASKKQTQPRKPWKRNCTLKGENNRWTCAIDEEDRESNSRCELIAKERGNMCRSDCNYYQP